MVLIQNQDLCNTEGVREVIVVSGCWRRERLPRPNHPQMQREMIEISPASR